MLYTYFYFLKVSEINTRYEKELPKSIAQMIRCEVRSALSEQVSISPGPTKSNNLQEIAFIKVCGPKFIFRFKLNLFILDNETLIYLTMGG